MARSTPEGGAVTSNTASNRTAAAVAVNSLTFVEAQNCVIECDGGKPLLIIVSFLATNNSGADRSYTCRITLGGAPASDEIVAKLRSGADSEAFTFHFYSDGTSIPKGSNTFAVEAKSDDATATQEWKERRLTIWEA